jgi:hypothetical protein
VRSAFITAVTAAEAGSVQLAVTGPSALP